MSYYEQDKTEKSYDLVKPGVYQATINEVRSKERNGSPSLSIEYKLENNRRLFQNFIFNEKGKKWISWQLGEIGVLTKAKETAKDNETPEQTCTNIHNTIVNYFMNKPLTIEVTHNSYKNASGEEKTTENVKVIPSIGMSVDSPVKFDQDEKLPF